MWKSFILEIGGSNHRPTRKVVQHISDIHEAGVDAIGQTFRGTEGELAFFLKNVVPLLWQKGVPRHRGPATAQILQAADYVLQQDMRSSRSSVL